MVPDKDQIGRLLRKYAPNEYYYDLVSTHGEIVAEIAQDVAGRIGAKVDVEVLRAACLLHDIGSYVFVGADNFSSDFKKCYPGHAIFGAKILQDEGLDDRIWQAVETHVLMGLSTEEIAESGFALPARDYFPQTIEARILCYADRFHSKHPTFNSYGVFLKKLAINFPKQAKKLEEWAEEFGLPDIEALAKKYGHPIR